MRIFDLEQLSTIHPRLENWANWSRDRMSRGKCCRSIERLYTSPQIWYPPDPRVFVDILDACKVEHALTNPLMERTLLRLLVWAYVRPWEDHRKVCRQAGINWNRCGDYLGQALHEAQNRLTLHAGRASMGNISSILPAKPAVESRLKGRLSTPKLSS